MAKRNWIAGASAPPAESLRVVGPAGLRGRVDREGGDYGAGLIAGVSMATRGEALGHDLWLDGAFIQQVYEAGTASESGLKARFAHPGLSTDGIGSALGRWKNFKRSGSKQVFADLHLTEAAHNAPDGDLAEYVMKLAEEDPELFAASIVFEPDVAAERQFETENSDDKGRFISPDRENRANLPHARLGALLGADLVDEPAANPGGLFNRGNALPAEAEDLMAYALGLSDAAPKGELLGVHPERARKFVQGFLARRGLSLRNIEGANGDDVTITQELAARVQSFATNFEAMRKQCQENKLAINKLDREQKIMKRRHSK